MSASPLIVSLTAIFLLLVLYSVQSCNGAVLSDGSLQISGQAASFGQQFFQEVETNYQFVSGMIHFDYEHEEDLSVAMINLLDPTKETSVIWSSTEAPILEIGYQVGLREFPILGAAIVVVYG